jgi:hypothetical protein
MKVLAITPERFSDSIEGRCLTYELVRLEVPWFEGEPWDELEFTDQNTDVASVFKEWLPDLVVFLRTLGSEQAWMDLVEAQMEILQSPWPKIPIFDIPVSNVGNNRQSLNDIEENIMAEMVTMSMLSKVVKD